MKFLRRPRLLLWYQSIAGHVLKFEVDTGVESLSTNALLSLLWVLQRALLSTTVRQHLPKGIIATMMVAGKMAAKEMMAKNRVLMSWVMGMVPYNMHTPAKVYFLPIEILNLLQNLTGAIQPPDSNQETTIPERMILSRGFGPEHMTSNS
jgi:hypothetical protein